jgi:hypothetical protein
MFIDAAMRSFEFCCRRNQAEKLLPQPQLFTAFGFSNVKPRRSRPS